MFVLLVAWGCATLGGPLTWTLTPREIERLIEKNFPLERAVAEIFDATVQAPRLNLLPERNRIAAEVDVALRQRLLGLRWNGRIRFDSALRWDAGSQTLRLVQVRVQDLAIEDNVGSASRNAFERLGAALAERVLEGMLLYRLPPERARQLEGFGRAPSEVKVTPRGVEITFSPIERP